MLYLNEDAVIHQIAQCQSTATTAPTATCQLCRYCNRHQEKLCPLAVSRGSAAF